MLHNIKWVQKLPNNTAIYHYSTIQLLRGFAAMMVVVEHSLLLLQNKINVNSSVIQFPAGAAGVDIFFAISGFVIILATYNNSKKDVRWQDFLYKRLIRIIPLYWLVTLIKLLLMLTLPSLTGRSSIDIWHSVASFLFIPAWDSNHETLPIVQVGWTLNYEMFFYIIFSIALAFNLRPIKWVSGFFVVLSLIGLTFNVKDYGAVFGLVRPLLLEFVFGMLIAHLTLKGYRLSYKLSAFLIALSISLLFATNFLPFDLSPSHYRVIFWGIPSAILLSALVSLEDRLHKRISSFSKLVGDASYAIYLIQGFAMLAVGLFLIKLEKVASIKLGTAIELGLCAGFSLVAGIIVHYFIEKPVTNALKNKVLK